MKTLKDLKIFVVGGDKTYANWMLGTIVDTLEEATLVLFTGGEDVSPEMYKASKHPKTSSNSYRDLREKTIFEQALKLDIQMIGICRGSQFLAVQAGAQLVQHQENPIYVHDLLTYDDKVIPITSTHHQAQYPYGLPTRDYQLLAWTKGISSIHEDGNQKEMPLFRDKEAEIVYYNKINALAIQGHPEHMFNRPEYQQTIDYLQGMLNKFIWGVYAEKSNNLTKQLV